MMSTEELSEMVVEIAGTFEEVEAKMVAEQAMLTLIIRMGKARALNVEVAA